MLHAFLEHLIVFFLLLSLTLSHPVNVTFLTLIGVYMTVCLFLFLFVHVGEHMIVLYPVNELLHVYISLHSLKFRNLYNTGYSETVMLHTHQILILLSGSVSVSISHSLGLCPFLLICVCQSIFASTCT